MKKARRFSPNEFYHIYNRGTEKKNIFLDKYDYRRFLALLYLCNNTKTVHLSDYGRSSLDRLFSILREKRLVHIGAYCLMKNHFHILLHEISGNGISTFMQKLATAYTMYFNKRYERSGVLFQGKFKSIHAKNDRYLKYLFSYIHLNPVETLEPGWKETRIKDIHKTREFLITYPYSSYQDYSDISRIESVILDRKFFPRYFVNKRDIDEEMASWLIPSPTVKVEP